MMHSQFQFVLALPEILLLVLTSALLLIDAFSKDTERRASFLLSLLILLIVGVVNAMQWGSGVVGRTFNGMYVVDDLSHFLKIASYIAVAVTFIYGREYAEKRDMMKNGGEFYTLTLFALLGQMVLISASNLLTLFLGLELMSFALYALIALRRENIQATESAMKYFILGSLASGILLYGLSMIYGATGELDLNKIMWLISLGQVETLPLVFGLVFIVAGLAFKLGAVPFHMWVPDVYHGAPTAVTLIVGAAPKLAAFALIIRLLVEGLHDLAFDWEPMLLILAVLSLAIGNLTAIVQTNFKRMLAYSTIAHMGFVLLGLIAGTGEGSSVVAAEAYGAALYYMVVYVLMTLASFGIILVLSRKGFECENIDDFKGLNQRNPILAGVLLVTMFSLTGIPPTVGFYAKLSILQVLIGAGHVVVAVLAVLFSLVGAFYYLRVVKVAYFDDPETDEAPALESGVLPNGIMSLNGLALILLGVLPGGLLALCVSVMNTSLRLF
ncbi:MAG TPA: NADH-quinone oxidoreductase subunit NuoN [Burkholderiaceae bacterium]|nr:NADH-quinone oxidoreductase subunit NuoN [Burkholderiaceae bacterium]